MNKNVFICCLLFCFLLFSGIPSFGAEPALPQGLQDEKQEEGSGDSPDLPAGLDMQSDKKKTDSREPELPSGLGGTGQKKKEKPQTGSKDYLPVDLTGFVDARAGTRIREDDHQQDASLGETRLQVKLSKYWDNLTAELTTDFLYDWVGDKHEVNAEKGEGAIDLRQANFSTTPIKMLDLKVGRQILTWGTGDQLFINDMFPKDWKSFFIGRDVEYLKAPSDAIKASLYPGRFTLNIVYTPRFDADRYIEGKRISYFNNRLEKRAGRNDLIDTEHPKSWFVDDEWAVRLYRNISGYELAAYAYDGYWKTPAGRANNKATFPELSVLGASVRGSFGPGIANAEVGYYHSGEDSDGEDPRIKNSETRLLLGYDVEIGPDFTLGTQYYLERMLDYGAYESNYPPTSVPKREENRHVFTLRLSKQLLMQNLELSLMNFYSPSDEDAYIRPGINYSITDHWSASMGGNIFFGEEKHTFFGQFKKNSNLYTGLRYNY